MKVFSEWTARPHDPIEQVADDLRQVARQLTS